MGSVRLTSGDKLLVNGPKPAHKLKLVAEAGATPGTVIEWLRQEHDVAIGVERLRHLCEHVSSRLEEQRESHQVQ